MIWEVKYLPNPRKILKKLDSSTKIKIFSYIKKLSIEKDPTVFGKALFNNIRGLWRFRVGDYRIICEIRKKEIAILVIDIQHRSSVYKRK